jgi:toxin ParE1/3/4
MAREGAWTEAAFDDLESIAGYVARDLEHYAAALVQEVIDAARSLAVYADRGQVVPELQDASLPELLVRPYRLVYRVEEQVVLILAVIHGSRRSRR